jgi:hypothetical protein
MQALIFSLKQFLRPYLFGPNKVIVRRDHATLTYVQRTEEPVAQLARHLDFIAQFDMGTSKPAR